MTNENYCDITFILDKSGSMARCVDDTIGGFNSFIKDQRKIDGKCVVNTYVFDSSYQQIHKNVPIAELDELTSKEYVAGGMTAYFDALGRAIDDAGVRFIGLEESERPGRVLFVVITDGAENSSQEYNRDQVAKMIKTQESDYDWDFVFLGADFDAVKSYGNMLGKAGRSANYGKGYTKKTLRSLSQNVSAYRGTSLSGKNAINLTDGIGDSN